MIYHNLYDKSPKKFTTAALIGTGHFGTALLTQSLRIPRLRIPAVADKNLDAARKTFVWAKIPEDQVAVCDSAGQARDAMEQGKYVIVQDPMLLMDLPLDMIVEGTGVPEDGAKYALSALEHGKHVIMLNKETDTCVGPVLFKIAKDKNLVYTQIDGDQHGLLIQLVEWARDNGMEVVTAAKARDAEFIYDRSAGTIGYFEDEVTVRETKIYPVDKELLPYLEPMPEDRKEEFLAKRRLAAKHLDPAQGYDLCEMLVVANAMDMGPGVPELNDCILRISEFPRVLCAREHGGILDKTGTIDVVTTLREPHETSMGGGVFIVVHCENEYSQHIIDLKGCLSNQTGTMSLVYRPWHLCGVEAPTSLLCVGLIGVGTGPRQYRPLYDVVQTAKVDLKEGEIMGGDKDPRLKSTIIPVSPIAGGGGVPLHMLHGRRLTRDVPAGTRIDYTMIDRPEDSVLWTLRELQDRTFCSGDKA